MKLHICPSLIAGVVASCNDNWYVLKMLYCFLNFVTVDVTTTTSTPFV